LGEWVGEIEVRIITDWLRGCNIKLEVRSNKEGKLYKTSQGMDVVHLYNPSERHFEYFSFEPEVDERESEVSRSGQGVPVVTDSEEKEEEGITDPCGILYDPCSGKPLEENTMKALEKRIRDIKKERDIIPVGLYGLTNDTSNYDFLTKVFIDPKVSLDDMVSFRLSEARLAGTDIYEVLSRLFVFFGGITNVNPRDGGNYKFMNSAEDGKIYNTSEDALRSMKCIASSGSGVSDITIVYVNSTQTTNNANPSYCEVDCDKPEKDNIISKTSLMSV
jgi:hypothetical protein